VIARLNALVHHLTLAFFLFAASCGPANADGSPVLAGEALIHALRTGGYNIYFRHAQTDWSQSDHIERAGDWTSCDSSLVRQLSDTGRRTARAVGEHIRALHIPVGKVLASPYCRTVETAELMDLGVVETTTDIMNLRVAEYFGGRDAILARARSRLAIAPPSGTNIALIAHGNVARGATDVYPDEAEAAIFQANGNGGFTFVGRLTPAQWAALARQQYRAKKAQQRTSAPLTRNRGDQE
jgi:broad specificity phosphatase PhoE